MQPLVVEATYENGVLKPDQPLPLAERQRIRVSVELATANQPAIDEDLRFVQETSGMLGWTGDAATVERVALDPEFGIHGSGRGHDAAFQHVTRC